MRFEFFRNEALNARNAFQSTNPVKPEYRRSQFGGTLGGPIVRDHTFFFVDYQGQRQSIGRTVISTVPTALQRSGVFTEAIAGKVPVIYDPATTSGRQAHAPFRATAFLPIASTRSPPACFSATRCRRLPGRPTTSGGPRPRPTIRTSGTHGSTTDSAARDQLFGRLSNFYDRFDPVTPLSEGSGVTTGTLGPQDTTVVGVRLELSACVLDRRC